MFSSLAQGKATWDGAVQLQDFEQTTPSPVEPLLPHLFLRSPSPYHSRSKSARTHDTAGTVLEDGQIVLPKTFVTRKGAILLFTPSEELIYDDHEDDSTHSRPLPDIYDVGLKLGTVANLTNSVLQFGREEEHAWEGVPVRNTGGGASGGKRSKDKQAFLKFLHYLDSDSGLDKFTQPGCDQDFYLDELKSNSGVHGPSQKRFRRVPSTKSHISFADDDDEMSDIITEYLRCSGRGPTPRNATGYQATSDHEVDGSEFNPRTVGEADERNSPEHDLGSASPEHAHSRPRTVAFSPYSFDITRSVCVSPTYCTDDSPTRPHTVPIPPQPQSPRANPRITSAKPYPPTRALGSTPTDLQGVLHSDLDIGRSHRRGSSPPPRFTRSRMSSPMYFPSSSRGESPEYGAIPRQGSYPTTFEDYPTSTLVIDEEDEASSISSRMDRAYRPSSAGSYRSAQSLDRSSVRRVSSAGTDGRRKRASASHAGSSVSSVSYQHTTASVFSHDDDLSSVHNMSEPSERELPGDGGISGRASPARSVRNDKTAARSQSVRSHRQNSRNERASPVPSRGNNLSTSRVASGVARAGNVPDDLNNSRDITGDIPDDDVAAASTLSSSRGDFAPRPSESQNSARSKAFSVSSQRSRDVISRQSTRDNEPAVTPNDTCATLGSEADLDEVAETKRAQSVTDSLLDDIGREEESPDGDCPPVTEEEYGSEAEEMDIMLADSRVSSRHSMQGDMGRPSPGDSLRLASPEETFCVEVLPDRPELDVDGSSDSSPDLAFRAAVAAAEAVQYQSPASSPPPISGIPIIQEPDKESIFDSSEELEEIPPSANYRPITPLSSVQILHPGMSRQAGPGDTGDGMGEESNFEIEKSRPSSPVSSEHNSHEPVSVTLAVEQYIKAGHEPQARSRQGSESSTEDKQESVPVPTITADTAKNLEASLKNPAASVKSPEVSAKNPAASVKSPEVSGKNPAASVKSSAVTAKSPAIQKEIQKPNSSRNNKETEKPTSFSERVYPASKDPATDLLSLNLAKQKDVPKPPEPTDEEKEARRELVSSFLNQAKPTMERGKLGLDGIGHETEKAVKPRTEALVKLPVKEEKKADLSDLKSLLGPPKTEKKKETRKKSTKQSKLAKKKAEAAAVRVDPENIDFDAFNSPEMLEHMDDELKQFIQQQGSNQPVAKEAAVAEEDPVAGGDRRTSTQTLDLPTFALQVPNEKEGAYSPSKTKKPSKKELAAKRAQTRKEEKKRREEEKKKKEKEKVAREQELVLLKQREEESAAERAEAEAKQRVIEEERLRRLADEEEAKKEEQEAVERLKDTKRKAREEREARRATEAERRRQEVHRKREEKQRREQEMRERENEAANQKLDRERRMAELAEQRRLQEEMEQLEEEKRKEEEQLRLQHEEEEERRLEEERVREAEEELQRLQEERELREQMRRIAEAQAEKLRKSEEERQKLEEEERRRIEEERRRLEEEKLARIRDEQKRQEMAKRLESVTRMRAAQQAAVRKSLLLRRREQNQERAQHLKAARQSQGLTRPFVFTYFVQIPKQLWELPIGYDKKKKGGRIPKRKPKPPPE